MGAKQGGGTVGACSQEAHGRKIPRWRASPLPSCVCVTVDCDGGLGKLSVLCSRQHPQVRSRRCLSAPAFCLAHQHTDTSSRVPALRPKHMQRFRPSRQRERRSVGIVLSLPHRSVLRNPGVRPVASSARWLARLTMIGGCLLSSV